VVALGASSSSTLSPADLSTPNWSVFFKTHFFGVVILLLHSELSPF